MFTWVGRMVLWPCGSLVKFTTGKLGNWEKYHQTYRVANVTLFSEPRGAFNVLQMNKVFSGEKKTLREWCLTRWQKGRRFNTLTTLDHHFLQLHYDLLTSWNSLSLFCTSIIPFRGGDLCPGTFGTPKLRNAASRYLVLSWEANDACIINKGLLIEAIEASVHQSSDSRGWTLTLLFAFFCSNTWRSWSITWRQGFSQLKMIQNH